MTRTLFISLILCLLAPIASYAQGSLSNIVESIEDSNQVSNVMYREKRDPRTRKVVRSTRLIVFSDAKLAKRLISAIKKERPNAVNYQASNERTSAVYCIDFNDNKGNFSRYSLIQEGGKRWTLSVETSYTDPKRNRNQQRRQ